MTVRRLEESAKRQRTWKDLCELVRDGELEEWRRRLVVSTSRTSL